MGFYAAPKLTNADKQALYISHMPSDCTGIGWRTVDFNFIRCEYRDEDGRTVLKFIHNQTCVLSFRPASGWDINAWDSVTTRKKLGMSLPPGLAIVVKDHQQWLMDYRSGPSSVRHFHRGDSFHIDLDGNVHGGDAWALGSILKRNMVDAEPVRYAKQDEVA